MRVINNWLILGIIAVIASVGALLAGYIGLGLFILVNGGSILPLGLYMAWLTRSGASARLNLGALPIALLFLAVVAIVVLLAFMYPV